ncbi:MAG: hypothetical protein II269_07420 [Bacteroidaceae bacterium]|nr:hypothetical protein [Bacteroidaceae bacterium]
MSKQRKNKRHRQRNSAPSVADTAQLQATAMTEVPHKGASAIVPRTVKAQKRGQVLNIGRNLLMQVRGDLDAVKALAMAIWVKNHTQQSRVTDCNPYRLHQLTGLHCNTIKKYIALLGGLNLIRWDGNDLVFGSLSERNNLHMPDTADRSIKELENMLLALYIVDIVKQKAYVKQKIEEAHNPKQGKEALAKMKRARRTCRDYGYGNEYREYGLSYNTVARRLDVSLQKASEVIQFAVENRMLVKEKRQEQFYAPRVKGAENYIDFGKGTFCMKNNIYTVYANVYLLPEPLTA